MIEQWDPPVDPLSCGPSERYALIILKTRQHPYRTLESLQGELEWQFQHGTIKDWTIESIEVCYDLTNSEFATALRQRCWTLHENNLQLLRAAEEIISLPKTQPRKQDLLSYLNPQDADQ